AWALDLPTGVTNPWTFQSSETRVTDGFLYFTAEDSSGTRELFRATGGGITQLTQQSDHVGFMFSVVGDGIADYLGTISGWFKIDQNGVSSVNLHVNGNAIDNVRGLVAQNGNLIFSGSANGSFELFETDGQSTWELDTDIGAQTTFLNYEASFGGQLY